MNQKKEQAMNDRQSTVLIYGSRGGQARALRREAVSAGHRVRIAERGSDTRLGKPSDPLDRCSADLDRPETLEAANRNIDQVLLTLPLGFDPDEMFARGKAAIDAAVSGGVKHIVYNTSIAVPDEPIGYEFFDRGMLRVMQYGQAADVSFLTLRPPLYLDNLLAPWTADGLLRDSELRYAIPGDIKLPWSSFQNQAEFMVAGLGRVDLDRRVLDIGLSNRYSGHDIAAAISQVLGRDIRFTPISAVELSRRVRPYWGEAAAEHIETLYALIGEDNCRLFKRDYANAIRTLRPSLASLRQWVVEAYGDQPGVGG